MGGYPGDKLQIIHPLHLFSLFPIPVTDLAFLLIESQALQRKERPDHGLTDPLGFFPGLGPDLAVDGESRMPPGEQSLGPLRADKLVADKKSLSGAVDSNHSREEYPETKPEERVGSFSP